MTVDPKLNLDGINEDILRLYLSTTADRLETIGVAKLSNSMTTVQELAHSLCGASAYLGFEEMTRLFRGLEEAGARESAGEASLQIVSIEEELGHIRRQIALRFPL
jgi:HPt (histidine-containing phosphotransfer) domain-containing protein